MANASANAFGFIPRKHQDGREYRGTGNPYYIPSTDTNNYFKGDVVTVQTQSGHSSNQAAIQANAGSAGPGGVGGAVLFEAGALMTVGQPTAGTSDQESGVIVGIGYDPVSNARAIYAAASVARVVWVETSRDVIYETRMVNLTTAPGLDCVGNTASLYLGAGGSTTTGASSMGLDGGTLQTSSGTTYQLRIMGASRDLLNNDLTSANPCVLVMINQSSETNAATAI